MGASIKNIYITKDITELTTKKLSLYQNNLLEYLTKELGDDLLLNELVEVSRELVFRQLGK